MVVSGGGGICVGLEVLFIYVGSWRSLIVCLFSSLRFWTNMECAYCVAIMLICLNMFLIFVIGIVSVVSNFFIDGICVVPLAPTTSTMSGATFQPFVMILLMSGWYFMIFLSRVSAENLSLQYVNSMNCMVISGVEVSGGGWLYGWPMMHNMSGLSQVHDKSTPSCVNSLVVRVSSTFEPNLIFI